MFYYIDKTSVSPVLIPCTYVQNPIIRRTLRYSKRPELDGHTVLDPLVNFLRRMASLGNPRKLASPQVPSVKVPRYKRTLVLCDAH
jgi:hypothetical protein